MIVFWNVICLHTACWPLEATAHRVISPGTSWECNFNVSQSGFLKRLLEAMLAETEVEYWHFLVGAGWQSLYLICPTNALKSYPILLAAVDSILLRLDLPQHLLCATSVDLHVEPLSMPEPGRPAPHMMHCTGWSGRVPAGIDFPAGRQTGQSPAAHVSRGVSLSTFAGADRRREVNTFIQSLPVSRHDREDIQWSCYIYAIYMNTFPCKNSVLPIRSWLPAANQTSWEPNPPSVTNKA